MKTITNTISLLGKDSGEIYDYLLVNMPKTDTTAWLVNTDYGKRVYYYHIEYGENYLLAYDNAND